MSFVSGGGSSERMPDYMPGQSPAEQEARRSAEAAQQGVLEARKQTDLMLKQQKEQTDAAVAETARLKGIEKEVADKADREAKQEEDRRQQRLVGGGIQRFMTAGYTGYGDSRPLGTASTLGG